MGVLCLLGPAAVGRCGLDKRAAAGAPGQRLQHQLAGLRCHGRGGRNGRHGRPGLWQLDRPDFRRRTVNLDYNPQPRLHTKPPPPTSFAKSFAWGAFAFDENPIRGPALHSCHAPVGDTPCLNLPTQTSKQTVSQNDATLSPERPRPSFVTASATRRHTRTGRASLPP